ncbi:hypothetical protein AK812_SmicGene36484 [Symbiodinium microadriaticum]|uniref:Uncharacterized protein n=1 Tax=Symbiodinium microadriaticum TaxID=2951 RepID=A0A1Q9CIR9_SYMMI|nr:hypothetical protein AK812_SmicGene36484 [Symbiodinium microadriaticum]
MFLDKYAALHLQTCVEDWINYHLAIGIEHFTVFDTDGSYEPYVRSYVDRGFVSYHPRFPKEVSSKLSLASTRASPRRERRQVLLEPHAIELCVWENRQVSDWVVVVHNMEEYLHSPFLGKGLPVVKLPEMIKTWAGEVPSVAVFEIFQEPMGGAGMDGGSTIFSRWTHKRGLEFSEDSSMKGAEEDAVHFQPFAFIVDPINVLQTAVHLAQARADDQAVVSISKDNLRMNHYVDLGSNRSRCQEELGGCEVQDTSLLWAEEMVLYLRGCGGGRLRMPLGPLLRHFPELSAKVHLACRENLQKNVDGYMGGKATHPDFRKDLPPTSMSAAATSRTPEKAAATKKWVVAHGFPAPVLLKRERAGKQSPIDGGAEGRYRPWSCEDLTQRAGDARAMVSAIPYGSDFGLDETPMTLRQFLAAASPEPAPAMKRQRREGVQVVNAPPPYFFVAVDQELQPELAETLQASLGLSVQTGQQLPFRATTLQFAVGAEGRTTAKSVKDCFEGACVFEQEEGDIVYVPDMWGHAVLNLEVPWTSSELVGIWGRQADNGAPKPAALPMRRKSALAQQMLKDSARTFLLQQPQPRQWEPQATQREPQPMQEEPQERQQEPQARRKEPLPERKEEAAPASQANWQEEREQRWRQDAALEAQARCAYDAVCNAYEAAKQQLLRHSPASSDAGPPRAHPPPSQNFRYKCAHLGCSYFVTIGEFGGLCCICCKKCNAAFLRGASMAADSTKGSLRAASPEQTQWLQRIRWFDFCAHLCLLTMLLPYCFLYVKDYTSGCMQIELAATFTVDETMIAAQSDVSFCSEKSHPRTFSAEMDSLAAGVKDNPLLEERDIGATVTTRWPSNDSRQR